MIFITVYVVVSATLGLSAWGNEGVGGGVSILAIGVLAFFSGAGLRGSFYYGCQQISGAAMAAVLCLATATWIGEGFRAQLFGLELNGSLWGWIGFFAAFVCNPGGARRYRLISDNQG
jgi:hypothetical protein